LYGGELTSGNGWSQNMGGVAVVQMGSCRLVCTLDFLLLTVSLDPLEYPLIYWIRRFSGGSVKTVGIIGSSNLRGGDSDRLSPFNLASNEGIDEINLTLQCVDTGN